MAKKKIIKAVDMSKVGIPTVMIPTDLPDEKKNALLKYAEERGYPTQETEANPRRKERDPFVPVKKKKKK